MVKKLDTKEEFKQALKDAGSKLVVVDFTASWCGPCQTISPKFVAMSKEDAFSEVVFYKVDVDENDETAEEQGIQAMPTFIFYRNGKKVDNFTGANEAKLREKLKDLM